MRTSAFKKLALRTVAPAGATRPSNRPQSDAQVSGPQPAGPAPRGQLPGKTPPPSQPLPSSGGPGGGGRPRKALHGGTRTPNSDSQCLPASFSFRNGRPGAPEPPERRAGWALGQSPSGSAPRRGTALPRRQRGRPASSRKRHAPPQAATPAGPGPRLAGPPARPGRAQAAAARPSSRPLPAGRRRRRQRAAHSHPSASSCRSSWSSERSAPGREERPS